MVASVPELTKRTISMLGTNSVTSLASSTSCGQGAPKLVPLAAVSCKRLDHARVGVAQNQRSPGQHVVDVAIVVHIDHVGAFAPFDEERLAAHRLEGTHRRIDTAGQQFDGLGEELLGVGVVHGWRLLWMVGI